MIKLLIYNTQYIDFYIQQRNIMREEFCKRCEINMDILNSIYEQKNMPVSKFMNVISILNISLDTFLFREKFHKITF